MQVTGQHVIAAPRTYIWCALSNPTILRRIDPACELVERIPEHRVTLHIARTKASPPEGLRSALLRLWSHQIAVTPVPDAMAHFEGSLMIELTDNGADTLVNYALDPSPVLLLAQFPPHTIRAIAVAQAGHFLLRLNHSVARRWRTAVACGCSYVEVQVVESLPQLERRPWMGERTPQLVFLVAMAMLSACLFLFAHLR